MSSSSDLFFPAQDISKFERGFEEPIHLKAITGEKGERKKRIHDYVTAHKKFLSPGHPIQLEVNYTTHKSKHEPLKEKKINIEVRLDEKGQIVIKELKNSDIDAVLSPDLKSKYINGIIHEVNLDLRRTTFNIDNSFRKENSEDLLKTIEFAVSENRTDLIESLNKNTLLKVAFHYPSLDFFNALMKIPSIKAEWNDLKKNLRDELFSITCRTDNKNQSEKIDLLFDESEPIKMMSRHFDLENNFLDLLYSNDLKLIESVLNRMERQDRVNQARQGLMLGTLMVGTVGLSAMKLLLNTLWAERKERINSPDFP